MSETTNLDDLRSYYDRLAKHDWFYEYANGRTYYNGQSVHQALIKEAKQDPAKAELLDQFKKYVYRKPGDDNPKPVRP